MGTEERAQEKQVQRKGSIREDAKEHWHLGDRQRKGSHKEAWRSEVRQKWDISEAVRSTRYFYLSGSLPLRTQSSHFLHEHDYSDQYCGHWCGTWPRMGNHRILTGREDCSVGGNVNWAGPIRAWPPSPGQSKESWEDEKLGLMEGSFSCCMERSHVKWSYEGTSRAERWTGRGGRESLQLQSSGSFYPWIWALNLFLPLALEWPYYPSQYECQ